jgi:alanine racemase
MGLEHDTRTGIVVVDLDAVARNYATLRSAAAPAECAAVVKANAYGLGFPPVVRRLFGEGCRSFFVATLSEGQALRSVLPEARIYVFEGVIDGGQQALAEAALIPVLNSIEQIGLWRGLRRSAVLHFDTGMSRLGLSAAEADELGRNEALLEGVEIEYLMTHLACADEPAHALNREQLRRFAVLRQRWPDVPTSAGNTAAALLGPEYCGDLARCGIGLYGGNPFIDRDNPMQPVVTMRARILELRTVDRAVTVGYGATYAAEPPARLAVVGVGYADGYRRCLGNRAVAAVNGTRVPVVGRISMDLLCLDVSAVATQDLRVGQWVELIGTAVPLDEVAAVAGTISYEILTGLGTRLQREYVGSM